jgi:hypothetical protein
MTPAASAFPVACRGVSERMGTIIIPCGSKILRSLLRRASIGIEFTEYIKYCKPIFDLHLLHIPANPDFRRKETWKRARLNLLIWHVVEGITAILLSSGMP